MTVVIDSVPFEVTTLRRDVETYGRHAKVAFGRDWKTDAERRDFTINALSVSRDGTVHDYVGGLADLAARKVRFIGVSLDESAARARQTQRDWGIPYDVVLGNRAFAKAYRIETLPTFMLIDERGEVREVATGTVSRSRLESWLEGSGAGRL